MTSLTQSLRRAIGPRGRGVVAPATEAAGVLAMAAPVAIAEHDPLLAFLLSVSGAADVDALDFDSPALTDLRAAGVKLLVPLVSSGDLIGTIALGSRRSEQEYSSEDRRLLELLAIQAAPSLRVAQLVTQQQAQARERQRIEQELQVAQLIQQNFLPDRLPQPDGWAIEAYYHPAREVGGDFYDVVTRPDGLIAFTIGDVTDKGVPAAMVMAATRSLLRASGGRLGDPGAVLARVNDLLHPDIPARMFVTCLYGLLDPVSGRLRFANAGHNLPYLRAADGTVAEPRATGMPLGLMAGMTYEEHEALMTPGQELLLHSDGIAEAHGPDGAMFGLPRLQSVVGNSTGTAGPIRRVLDALEAFTRPGWEQEDDITLLSLRWSPDVSRGRVVAAFELPSEPGREREAMERVAEAVTGSGLAASRMERLKTAVAEATMNAIEHGNQGDSSRNVGIRVIVRPDEVVVAVTDEGGGAPPAPPITPDLDAKLRGEQTPRGWGLFLIENMVDATRVHTGDGRHTLELVVRRTEAPDD